MRFISSLFKKVFAPARKGGSPSKEVKPSKQDIPASRAYFSPGDDCLNIITNSLSLAKSSVDICVFTISDDRISKAVLACHSRNVKVRVITDNEKSSDLGSDISTFAKKGIAVKTDCSDAHLHHKFVIIDKKVLLNGSYNWTRSAAEYNEENVVLSYEPELIRAFSAEFEKLWKRTTGYGGS